MVNAVKVFKVFKSLIWPSNLDALLDNERDCKPTKLEISNESNTIEVETNGVPLLQDIIWILP